MIDLSAAAYPETPPASYAARIAQLAGEAPPLSPARIDELSLILGLAHAAPSAVAA